jgi:hypothetical protein
LFVFMANVVSNSDQRKNMTCQSLEFEVVLYLTKLNKCNN